MAIQFIVEDGTGLSDSSTYLDVAELKQLWENVGYSFELLTDEQIQVGLNKATAVLDSKYAMRYPGARNSTTQKLCWPRLFAYYIDSHEYIDNTVIPVEIKNALSEYLYAQLKSGVPLQPTLSAQGNIIEETKTVDVVTVKKRYSHNTSTPYSRTTITAVEDALSRLIGSGENNANDFKIIRV